MVQPGYWQTASVILLAVFGSAIGLIDTRCNLSGDTCFLSEKPTRSSRIQLGTENRIHRNFDDRRIRLDRDIDRYIDHQSGDNLSERHHNIRDNTRRNLIDSSDRRDIRRNRREVDSLRRSYERQDILEQRSDRTSDRRSDFNRNRLEGRFFETKVDERYSNQDRDRTDRRSESLSDNSRRNERHIPSFERNSERRNLVRSNDRVAGISERITRLKNNQLERRTDDKENRISRDIDSSRTLDNKRSEDGRLSRTIERQDDRRSNQLYESDIVRTNQEFKPTKHYQNTRRVLFQMRDRLSDQYIGRRESPQNRDQRRVDRTRTANSAIRVNEIRSVRLPEERRINNEIYTTSRAENKIEERTNFRLARSNERLSNNGERQMKNRQSERREIQKVDQGIRHTIIVKRNKNSEIGDRQERIDNQLNSGRIDGNEADYSQDRLERDNTNRRTIPNGSLQLREVRRIERNNVREKRDRMEIRRQREETSRRQEIDNLRRISGDESRENRENLNRREERFGEQLESGRRELQEINRRTIYASIRVMDNTKQHGQKQDNRVRQESRREERDRSYTRERSEESTRQERDSNYRRELTEESRRQERDSTSRRERSLESRRQERDSNYARERTQESRRQERDSIYARERTQESRRQERDNIYVRERTQEYRGESASRRQIRDEHNHQTVPEQRQRLNLVRRQNKADITRRDQYSANRMERDSRGQYRKELQTERQELSNLRQSEKHRDSLNRNHLRSQEREDRNRHVIRSRQVFENTRNNERQRQLSNSETTRREQIRLLDDDSRKSEQEFSSSAQNSRDESRRIRENKNRNSQIRLQKDLSEGAIARTMTSTERNHVREDILRDDMRLKQRDTRFTPDERLSNKQSQSMNYKFGSVSNVLYQMIQAGILGAIVLKAFFQNELAEQKLCSKWTSQLSSIAKRVNIF